MSMGGRLKPNYSARWDPSWGKMPSGAAWQGCWQCWGFFLGSGLLQGAVDKPRLLVTAWGQQQMVGMSCRKRDTVIKHPFGHFLTEGKSVWLCWLHRFMLVQENRSDVFMLLSARCCKFSTAGTEGTSCNTAAWSGLNVLGLWLVAPGAVFVLRALPPPLASLSGATGGTRGHLSWSRFLPFIRHFHTGYLPFLMSLSCCSSPLN